MILQAYGPNSLESAILNKVVLIWTCRPFEWKYFKEKIDDKYQNKIEYCDLPLLSKDNLSPFPDFNLLDIDCSDISDFNIENAQPMVCAFPTIHAYICG